MSPLAPVFAHLGRDIAERTGRLGRRVEVESMGVLDRDGHLDLAAPGRVSPNGSCRLVRAADGWIAVNLPREDDRALVPAWLERSVEGDPWSAVATFARERGRAELLGRAILLNLPAACVGEVRAGELQPPLRAMGEPRLPAGPVKVLDMSALWAGPLCGAVLADMGAQVTRLDSVGRPDPSAVATPEFFRRLNGLKPDLQLDLKRSADRLRLIEAARRVDLLITAARPRALAALGLAPADLFAANPGLVWVAITGHGWTGDAAERVAFGDDAAAAGGLLRWTTTGEPNFLGDALADPVTGLCAAAAALRGLEAGGGVLVDVALARCAAGAAAHLGLERAT